MPNLDLLACLLLPDRLHKSSSFLSSHRRVEKVTIVLELKSSISDFQVTPRRHRAALFTQRDNKERIQKTATKEPSDIIGSPVNKSHHPTTTMDPQTQSSASHSQPPRGQQQQQQQQQSQQQAPQQPQQPVYDVTHGGHYGASVALSQQGFAPSELYTGTWANVHQGLSGQYKDILTAYWQQTINHLETDTHDYKMHQLPLARIKKVMKADPEVKMISAEAPILFAKGCDIFITELTMRAWIHAEENKRRTLQRSDIASALAKSDMFDFLIDIVPREEASSHAKRTAGGSSAAGAAGQAAGAPVSAGGQHQMAPADYGALGVAPEGDYRNPATMYPGQVQPGAAGYGQPQAPMYGVDDMYAYGTMPPQQV
ncbi:histone-fold-containing protein [Cladorrhinum sp. PSN332]|nr:histone-fold-containing protein [Cladorrhinum sp. PSN332]